MVKTHIGDRFDTEIRLRNFYNDTRSVALTFSYNFGKNTVKGNRDRDTPFQDVKARIG